MRLIPAIDLRGGHCVRLLQGDFAAETRYEVDPGALLARYRDLGADWLHVVDLDAARDGDADGDADGERGGGANNRALIAELAAGGTIKLQVGGGLRSRAAVARALESGAARAVVGSAALHRADEVRAWLNDFGPERIVLAFDVRLDAAGAPEVLTHGWRRPSERSLWSAVADYVNAGLVHVLCTDVSRDGALAGPNVALYREAVRRFPELHWQASGGIRNAPDLASLAACGAAAAISGKALLEGLIADEELRPYLPNA